MSAETVNPTQRDQFLHVALRRVHSFVLILGRVGSSWVTSLVDRIGPGQENWTNAQLWCERTLSDRIGAV